jgi:hypothetical protein
MLQSIGIVINFFYPKVLIVYLHAEHLRRGLFYGNAPSEVILLINRVFFVLGLAGNGPRLFAQHKIFWTSSHQLKFLVHYHLRQSVKVLRLSE